MMMSLLMSSCHSSSLGINVMCLGSSTSQAIVCWLRIKILEATQLELQTGGSSALAGAAQNPQLPRR